MTDMNLTTRPSSPAVRTTLQLEGAAIAGLAVWAYAQGGFGWWLFAILILAPDLAMLGYAFGTRLGAVCYNVAHSYLAPVTLAVAGYGAASDLIPPIALIWVAHIGADRAIGYGLKYSHHFKDTHLGRV